MAQTPAVNEQPVFVRISPGSPNLAALQQGCESISHSVIEQVHALFAFG